MNNTSLKQGKRGVKTQAGKMVSRMNALTHGGLSNRVSDAEAELYSKVFSAFTGQYEETGIVRRLLLEQITLCVLKMRRVAFAEIEYLRAIDDPPIVESPLDDFGFSHVIHEGYRTALSPSHIETLMDVHNRYAVRLQNQFLRLSRALESDCFT